MSKSSPERRLAAGWAVGVGGEVTSDRERKAVGPNTAIFFPMGSKHGIRNVGRGKLKYLSIHAPPYDIESLYKTWEGALLVLGG